MKEQIPQKTEIPTFTPKQEIILNSWYSDELLNMNVSDRCKALDVDRSTYYEALKMPAFKAALQAKQEEIVKERLPRVHESVYKKALTGDMRAARLFMERFDSEFKTKIDLEQKSINLNFNSNVDTNDLEKLQSIIRQSKK